MLLNFNFQVRLFIPKKERKKEKMTLEALFENKKGEILI